MFFYGLDLGLYFVNLFRMGLDNARRFDLGKSRCSLCQFDSGFSRQNNGLRSDRHFGARRRVLRFRRYRHRDWAFRVRRHFLRPPRMEFPNGA